MDDSGEQLGLGYQSLRLVHANPAWVDIATALVHKVSGSLGSNVVAVEHVGSTSVPGLLCKPIIDLAAGLPGTTDDAQIRPLLVEAGWIYRGDAGDQGGHIYVFESSPWVRIAHLHGVEHGGPQWNRYLQFREHLRDDAAARAAYTEAKLALLDEHGHSNSREAYTQGKDEIVNTLLGSGGGSP